MHFVSSSPSSRRPIPRQALRGGRIKNFVFGRDDSDGPFDFDTLEQLQEWITQEK